MKLPDMFDLRGRTVLVTGAASGLGLAIAEAMLEAGARAVLSDCDEQAAWCHRLRVRQRRYQRGSRLCCRGRPAGESGYRSLGPCSSD